MNDTGTPILLHGIGLTKIFGTGVKRVEVFKDLNFLVNEGERIAIVGASGVGKSTLLHILGTLDKPTAGKVYFKGQDVFLLKNEELARFRNKHIGFVFQFHYLLPEFTALENVMMPGIISGMPRKHIFEKSIELLHLLGLGRRVDHKVGELSGGEQQRVAIARALVMEPMILMADEPTGNLDTKTAKKIHEMLVNLNEDFGLTMVIVTHNIEFAAMMNRVLHLVDGRLVPYEF